jgi:hypothetical protein
MDQSILKIMREQALQPVEFQEPKAGSCRYLQIAKARDKGVGKEGIECRWRRKSGHHG